MNLLPMNYFLTVAKLGSISRAAAEEHVTQQTMSAHIAALEAELGCVLFERYPHFRLTYEGEVFQRYCQRFLQLSEAMDAEFADIRNEQGGALRVGTAVTRGRVWMPSIIHEFHESFPLVEVDLFESQNDHLIEALIAGDIEIALGRIPAENASYEYERLYEEQIILVLPKSLTTPEVARELEETRDLTLLTDVPFMMSKENDIAGAFGRLLLQEAHLNARVSIESDSAFTLIALACLGEGACFCPDSLIPVCASEADMQKLYLIPLGVTYNIGIAWRAGIYTDQRTRAFVDAARACVEDTQDAARPA